MLTGWYFDPKHGGCLRTIRPLSDGRYRIFGVYGDDEAPHTHQAWFADVRFTSSTTMCVDFAGKVKPQRFLTAQVRQRTIVWEDGNVWIRMYVHPPTQLRRHRPT